MQDAFSFVRAFFERICLVGWMILMMANTIMVGLTVELLLVGIILSFNHITLIDHGTLPFLAIGFIAALNFPVVVKLHELGVAHLNFESHENMLKYASESWETLILTLLDEKGLRSHKLEKLVQAINNAASAAERQERRAEAKAWLVENQDRLTDEDKEIVLEHLGYLKIR
jgi:hypothetical protein